MSLNSVATTEGRRCRCVWSSLFGRVVGKLVLRRLLKATLTSLAKALAETSREGENTKSDSRHATRHERLHLFGNPHSRGIRYHLFARICEKSADEGA
jgi:hypothetical protein